MERDSSLDIAVTGIGGRFPGASDLTAWWEAVTAGRVLTTRYQPAELRAAGVPQSLLDRDDYVPVGGWLADADRFDHTFFRVSPRDAEMMDPQHRLMIEMAWTALEDAGTGIRDTLTTTAVYASGSGSGYLRAMLSYGALDRADLDQALHGNEPDFIASLISYKLGLTGPALGVQTACSSGLVGVHLAVQALLSGDCDRAVVVAAGIDFPQGGYVHTPGGIQSGSGRCRPFDAEADGVVAGSGVACVVLRRLADAVADGCDPYGVILGSAINNDGSAKAGYYAPSAAGQQAVITAALRTADVDARSIGYLEAHATGTRVGDPIEWSAASGALASAGARPGQIAVGALKANIGHLDAAAGIAGLIKALLVLREGVVPPVAGFARLNPLLETEDAPLYVPTVAGPWTGPEPRRAGVSAFGIGGTNAHVIIEQAPPRAAGGRSSDDRARLLLLSAADPAALSRSAERLGTHLASSAPDLDDVAATLAGGRVELRERLAVSGCEAAEVADRLAGGAGVVRGSQPADRPAPVAFIFPGQGSQSPGMAAPFADALPGFTAELDACLAAFDPPLAARLRRALLDPTFPIEELDATELAQPALFAVEYAAAAALRTLGLSPVAVAGHSLGEITAACVAGILDLADAARFVTARGRGMQLCPAGAMLAVGDDEGSVLAAIARFGGPIELAAVNGPDSCTVAGPADAIAAFRASLDGRMPTKRLRTVRAFHSGLIEDALPAIEAVLATVAIRPSRLPLAANVSGTIIPAGTRVPAELFVEQARRPVRFGAALAALAERFPGLVTVEVGPGGVLSALAAAAGIEAVALSPAGAGRVASPVLTALGALWTIGQPIRTAALIGPGRPIHLPGYPFAGPRWLAPEAVARMLPAPAGPAPTTQPEIDRPGTEAAEATPADVSELMASLWTELLGHTDIDVDSDFFDLGGDSLLITNLARKVNQRLGIKVPIRAMLSGRTLGRQTSAVRAALAGADIG